jgi:S1-C subfamily serine protease
MEQCRKLGGNALEVTLIESPDSWSTSYRVSANAYRISVSKIDSKIEKTGYTKNFLIKNWDENGLDSPIEGIYERVIDNSSGVRYELAVKKIDNSTFYMIYLSGAGSNVSNTWKEGDLKAICTKTATSNLYKVEWYMLDKTKNTGVYASFDEGKMDVVMESGTEMYLKLYPYADGESFESGITTIPSNGFKWTGTGFAINGSGYIATNYHVTNGANHIYVYGVGGDFNKSYSAKVIASDQKNDLAIIKVEDSAIDLIGTPPYDIVFKTSDVGSDVVAFGYPLTTTMGEELKVTNGIISAKTGFQGDATTYQVSVPVQSGNSGGPLFNADGDVVGIISSKHRETDNVSYAIKSSYLYSLVMSSNSEIDIQSENTLRGQPLTTQVSKVRNFVFLLKCD